MSTKQSTRFTEIREFPRQVLPLDKSDLTSFQILHPPKADTSINLMLRPEDVMSRPMRSTSSGSNNVLLKVTVPKRTGRKRKRGSDDPFTQPTPAESPERPAARDILRSLRDNVGRYHIEPVGLVQRTHVFRGMSPRAMRVWLLNIYRDAGLCFLNDGESVCQPVPGSDSLV